MGLAGSGSGAELPGIKHKYAFDPRVCGGVLSP